MGMAIRRGIVIVIGIILQILLSLFSYLFIGEIFAVARFLYVILGFLLVLNLIKNSKSYSYILPWIIIILLSPVIGSLLYVIIGRNKKKSKILKNITKMTKESKKYLLQDDNQKDKIAQNGKIKYLTDYSGYPASNNNDIDYYSLGDYAYEDILEELKKAEKFIFFEYFIVAKGKFWNSILQILEEKAADGVDVRVMYDDLGCISTLKSSYPKELKKKGIKCVAFNKLKPIGGVIMNNRDHRKILVIDGKVAFSGGINIADEYININSKYGHWKDNCIKISGDAVWNYTVMFLTIWNAFKNEDKDFMKYKFDFSNKKTNSGYVIPYGETPLDDDITGEDVYLNIINQAEKYVYIMTPYLIIDTDMINSLILATRRGVDVRIVIPGIPDKKMVYMVSESFVEPLVKGGVKVYRYTPGFVHSKVFVSDDKITTVGTINMDFRSLYLHFECGCYIESLDIVQEVKNDVIDTIEKSRIISAKEATPKFFKSICQSLLRLVAPLM